MINTQKRPVPPSDDPRWKAVRATMRRFGYSSDALIETLHTVQNAFGYVNEETLYYIAESLNIPPSKVFGVATFYSSFKLSKPGDHVLSLCLGTACYVKGADQIVDFMREKYGLEIGETTADGKLSFVTARCVGACSLAPVMLLDGEVVGKLSIEQMKQRIEEWVNHDWRASGTG